MNGRLAWCAVAAAEVTAALVLVIVLVAGCRKAEERQGASSPDTIEGQGIIMYRDGHTYRCDAPWKGHRVVCVRLVEAVVLPDAGAEAPAEMPAQ